MPRRVYIEGLLIFILTSCATPTPVPTSTPPPAVTLTPSPVPSATPVELILRVTRELVNCRYGPSVAYARVSDLKGGQFARVVGRDAASAWWLIRDPVMPGGTCWVAAQVSELTGEASLLPVVNAPQITVTGIKLRIEPIKIFVPCGQFPQTIFFESRITANGPTLAVWQLEASTGYISEQDTIIFEEAGDKQINGVFHVPAAGDYWIQIHVLKPNERIEKLNFPASCSP